MNELESATLSTKSSPSGSGGTTKRSFNLTEYKKLLKECEDDLGYTIPKIENGPLVRNGNTTNSNGMYGRVREDALERIFNIMKLKPTDVFIDLGHGIGLVSIQAAYTRACESRGIEKDKDRNKFASDLKDTFVKRLKHSKENNVTYNDEYLVGQVTFKQGDFSDLDNLEFITSANKVFVNNAEGIFSHREDTCTNKKRNCSEIDGRKLDDFIATLFAKMKPNTIMITLDQIASLGRSVDEENKHRVNIGLTESPNASFFQCYREHVGNCAKTWGGDLSDLYVWVYTRTDSEGFLCSDTKCLGKENPTCVIQPCGFHLIDTCIYCSKSVRKPPSRHTVNRSEKVAGKKKIGRRGPKQSTIKKIALKKDNSSSVFENDSDNNKPEYKKITTKRKIALQSKRKNGSLEISSPSSFRPIAVQSNSGCNDNNTRRRRINKKSISLVERSTSQSMDINSSNSGNKGSNKNNLQPYISSNGLFSSSEESSSDSDVNIREASQITSTLNKSLDSEVGITSTIAQDNCHKRTAKLVSHEHTTSEEHYFKDEMKMSKAITSVIIRRSTCHTKDSKMILKPQESGKTSATETNAGIDKLGDKDIKSQTCSDKSSTRIIISLLSSEDSGDESSNYDKIDNHSKKNHDTIQSTKQEKKQMVKFGGQQPNEVISLLSSEDSDSDNIQHKKTFISKSSRI